MKKNYIIILLLFPFLIFSQTNSNGQLDLISELSTKITVPFTMPDGVVLETDIYLPILSDSVTFNIGGNIIELIPKGTQLFVYDSIGNTLNPNKYQLPLVFTRTPYNKDGGNFFGLYLNMLGYAYAMQDMRGRYNSEGVYLPMYSDGWKKGTYHQNDQHALDITSLSDVSNGNNHADGANSIKFITDSLYRYYDLDGDGTNETYDKLHNGSIVMFGASALGNTQYQAASSLKNNVNQDGLKGLIPIVATNEYFNSVIQHNGVFREALVGGWLSSQLNHNININPLDNDIQNSIHSIFDYGNMQPDTILKRGIDNIVSIKDENGFTGIYPNSLKRYDSDASIANVNSLGESDINGLNNRYSNMELPIYHLTGWWDIFIDGQIDTYNNIMKNTSAKTNRNQKLVIGPWTHGTIAQDTVSDLVFPSSVFDLNVINYTEALDSNFSKLLEGELIDWFRYLLNYDSSNYIGEPKILIPESNNWQNYDITTQVRVPSEDFYINYSNFINFISGFETLENIPYQIDNSGTITNSTISIPSMNLFPSAGSQAVTNPVSPPINFEEIPNIRYYVPGPIADSEIANNNVGNYWTSTENFPPTENITEHTLYFHSNGELNTIEHENTEAPLTYIHNPNNPVHTLGGGNLTISTPFGVNNTGPMNYANPLYSHLTMDRADVLKFETDFIIDSLSIVGVPKMKLYASSNPLSGPNGETDTDFFVRILDVYPDGREIYVVEGAINSRAIEYAKSLTNGTENINATYSNITEGEIYEYVFNLLPIAYTFGHNHKIKILISSSNWPRYQCNANVPIEDGDFFRRKPNDSKTYTYNSVVYFAREAEQEIHFSPSHKTQIILPLFGEIQDTVSSVTNLIEEKNILVYPNPSQGVFHIQMINKNSEKSILKIKNTLGKIIFTKTFKNSISVNIKNQAKGIYFIEIENNNNVFSEKIIFN